MKTYIKPNTECYKIEPVLMSPASPGEKPVVESGTLDPGSMDSKETSLPGSNNIWGEEE